MRFESLLCAFCFFLLFADFADLDLALAGFFFVRSKTAYPPSDSAQTWNNGLKEHAVYEMHSNGRFCCVFQLDQGVEERFEKCFCIFY